MPIPDLFFKYIVQNTLDVVTVLSKAGTIEYESPSITTILGYDQQELIGKNSLQFVHPVDIAYVSMAMTDGVLNPGKEKLVRFRFKHKDGTYRLLESHAQYVHTDQFEGTVVISRDITDTRIKDDKIKMLVTAIEKSENIVFMTDPDGLITYINPAFTQTYGYTSEEVILKTTPRILKSGLLTPEFYTTFWQKIKQNTNFSGEFKNKRKDGTLVSVGFSANPVIDDTGKILGFISIQHDLTKRIEEESKLKQKEAILQEKNNELERMNKLMIDRELRMIELKKELETLKKSIHV